MGKDIGGQVVVTDIAKMPHLLIAGATGSGKSVCINTLIMSILYKAKPDEVKMIMIDPKVVELSVYNGIPHLFIPVVTDPKKAAGALNWAVSEMSSRYNTFAEYGVRNLKEYNHKVENLRLAEGDNRTDKDAADRHYRGRACGSDDGRSGRRRRRDLPPCAACQSGRHPSGHRDAEAVRQRHHRPDQSQHSSRIAFAVASGVDSRIILDMNGAEKLLGKGDMLFYPQGYPKPRTSSGLVCIG